MLKPFYSNLIEAGLDEAGRGCLAGPVMAASVILPRDYFSPLLNDSKQLSKSQRELLREEIEQEAVEFAVGEVSNQEIDQINILNASFLAMHRALDSLNSTPEFLIIDGNRFNPYKKIKHACIVKGDGKYFSIAAASVLAKTYRDQRMEQLASEFPGYDWENNKGYPTRKHRKAIEEKGCTPFHRMSFNLLNNQIELF